MKNTLFIILLIIMIGVLSGQDAPIVSNVTLAQNGSMARISYDLLCSSPCQIILKISDDSGATFTIVPNSASLSGDFGSLVNPGTGKVIHWNIASDGIQGSGFRARVIARNLDEDVFVEGGLIGIHTVSDFYIGRHELTQAEYFITMGYNPAQSFGVGDNYPIHSVNWFDAIEYCNRRSMMDGYIPCYSFEGLGTDPDLWPIGWKTINDNQNKIFWDWTANGYRLPTTEEWKFAAKGGNQSMDYRFSGSDIANEVAWHSGNCDPYSCMPVGLKLPNELGIYDMSGNQSEWRWDFYWPFGTISTPSSDPTGPFFGITKIHGGGSWDFGLPPVTTITTSLPSVGYVHNGFRIARSATFPSTTLPTPVIGVDSGSYSTTKIVHITTSLSGASIRYTIDGSTPSKDHGKVYTQPIVINKSTVLKAIAINNGFFPSQVVTRTYTIWISAPEPLLPVAGGTFHNGTSNITISSFHMDKFEVTQAGYERVTGLAQPGTFAIGANKPAYSRNWYQAVRYCNLRSIQEGLEPCYSFWYFGTDPNVWPSNFSNFVMGAGDTRNLITCNWNANGYRLPTEMEWMFAAKGGNLSQCFIYSGSDDLSRVGWYDGNSGGEPHEVGMRTPNELGLFDMSGNVSELVWDNLGPYPHDDQTNPTGFPYSEYGIIRGGSFYRPDTYSTVAYRDQNGYTTNSFIVGIRVVRRISP